MEKFIRTTLAALVLLPALTGCRHAEQEWPDASGRRHVPFHAEAADTRTAFTEAVDGVYQTLWTENDSEILLSLNYGTAESSAVTASADGRTAAFDASFDVASTSSPYTFYAVSPASAARAISPSRKAWSVYIAAEQTPSTLSVDEGAQLLVAKSEASAEFPRQVDLRFAHLTAYGRITLKNMDLGDAKVEKVDLVFDTPVVGEWYWSEDGTLTSNGASHTITLNTDASEDLWFACAPVSVGGVGMSINLYTTEGVMSKEITFPEGRAFASGKVARFSIDMTGITISKDEHYSLVLNESELVPGSVIIFLNASGTMAMGAPSRDGHTRKAVSDGFRLSPGGVDLFGGQVAVFTVVDGYLSGRTWGFQDEYGYLASTDSEEDCFLVSQTELDRSSGWLLSYENDGVVNAQTVGGKNNKLRYNAESSLFSLYPTSNNHELLKIYKKDDVGFEATEDPLTDFSEYGCYLAGNRRTFVRGADQLLRIYDPDGKVRFILLNEARSEQLVVSGYDPALRKGDEAALTVSYRIGDTVLLEREINLVVVKEDGAKVWLGDGSGQGFIIKK